MGTTGALSPHRPLLAGDARKDLGRVLAAAARGSGAGERIEGAGHPPDVDEVGARDPLDVPRSLDPVALDGARVGGRVVLVIGGRGDHVVVVAVVQGGEELRAAGDLIE